MKLRDIFVSEDLFNERILVSTDETVLKGFIRANETAAFIIDCLLIDTTVDEIIAKVVTKYDIDENTARQSIEFLLLKLQELNMLDD